VTAVGVVVGVVVVAGGAFVVADRVSAHHAEQRIATAVEQNLDGVVGTPRVHVEGFPFLTQLAAGSLDHVTGTIDGATLSGVSARDVVFDGRDVTTTEPYSVGDATVTATLPTAAVQQLVDQRTGLDVDLAVSGDALRASGSVLGVTLTADLEPHATDGKLTVDVQKVTVGGLTVSVDDLPGGLGDRLQDLTIPVTGLPTGMGLADVAVVDDGLRVTATGEDVRLEENGSGAASR
jgi:archaellum component FlaF (FlaF/FlaG flagellin family)